MTNLTEEVAKNDIASKSISKSSLTIASENRRLKSTIRSLQRDILSLKKEMGIATLNYRNELEEVIEAARIELDAKEIQIQELEQEQSTIKEELERLKEEFGNKEKTYQASQEELRQESALLETTNDLISLNLSLLDSLLLKRSLQTLPKSSRKQRPTHESLQICKSN